VSHPRGRQIGVSHPRGRLEKQLGIKPTKHCDTAGPPWVRQGVGSCVDVLPSAMHETGCAACRRWPTKHCDTAGPPWVRQGVGSCVDVLASAMHETGCAACPKMAHKVLRHRWSTMGPAGSGELCVDVLPSAMHETGSLCCMSKVYPEVHEQHREGHFCRHVTLSDSCRSRSRLRGTYHAS